MSQTLKKSNQRSERKTHSIKKKVSKTLKGQILQGRDELKSIDMNTQLEQQKNKIKLNYYSMYQSNNSYVLDDINSIAYANDRIYDLMKLKPKNLWGRILKCKCSKSKCEAKYCQCFSRNQICSSDCGCQGCNNTNQSRFKVSKPKEEKQEGCRCSKSGCLKNYCDCFQRGENCSEKCKCLNCKNSF